MVTEHYRVCSLRAGSSQRVVAKVIDIEEARNHYVEGVDLVLNAGDQNGGLTPVSPQRFYHALKACKNNVDIVTLAHYFSGLENRPIELSLRSDRFHPKIEGVAFYLGRKGSVIADVHADIPRHRTFKSDSPEHPAWRFLEAVNQGFSETPVSPISPQWESGWKRNKERYGHLCGFKIEDFVGFDDFYADVGGGMGIAASEIAAQSRTVVCVNLHRWPSRSLRQMLDEEKNSNVDWKHIKIPDNQLLWAVLAKRAKLVTDVYGAASYDHGFLKIMAHHASLVGYGGKAVIVTEGDRIDPETLAKFGTFIASYSGQRLTSQIFADRGDISKAWGKVLRVTITGEAKYEPVDLISLYHSIDEKFGRPKPGLALWESKDRSASIPTLSYPDQMR